MSAQATYALWGNKKGDDCTFFLGYGTLLSTPNVVIKAETPADVLLEFKKGHGTTLHRLIALSVFKRKRTS